MSAAIIVVSVATVDARRDVVQIGLPGAVTTAGLADSIGKIREALASADGARAITTALVDVGIDLRAEEPEPAADEALEEALEEATP